MFENFTTSPFHNDTGNLVTRSLFWEEHNVKEHVRYTLKDRDYKGYPSLYRLYMEEADVTEWKFVEKNLYSWEHWELLCAANWFKPYISRWRKELELKLRSDALQKIRNVAANASHKQTLEANKYLLSGNWMPKAEAKGRGRPSKDEIKEEANRLAVEEKKLQDDLERVLN